MTYQTNSNRQEHNEEQESRRGADTAVWISIGTGLGVALGLVLDNLALGIAIGAAIGVAVGTAMSQSRKGAAVRDVGIKGGRWIYGIAAFSGLLLLIGLIILVQLMAR
jgi:2-methylcitrate dehydratase PrpD